MLYGSGHFFPPQRLGGLPTGILLARHGNWGLSSIFELSPTLARLKYNSAHSVASWGIAETNYMRTPAQIGRRLLWMCVSVAAAAGIAAFFIPAFIIRPFTYQSPRGLLFAMATRDRAPLVSLICAVATLLLVSALWRSGGKWTKVVLSTMLALVAASAVMSRLNYFEWMFHPVKTAQFEAESASKLDKGEMVMAVRFGSDARAYPIREMAYHHILNDVVGGTPIAVTY